jgi:hypothetical protein
MLPHRRRFVPTPLVDVVRRRPSKPVNEDNVTKEAGSFFRSIDVAGTKALRDRRRPSTGPRPARLRETTTTPMLAPRTAPSSSDLKPDVTRT